MRAIVAARAIASQVEELRASGEAEGKALLLVGPPSTGKTRWAREWAKQNRSWRERESDIASIRRIVGLGDLKPHEMGDGELATGGPFRAPHHTVSEVGLTGMMRRGFVVQPGEVSIAHGGTLFLDEVIEFQRQALEMVRSVWALGFVRLSSAAVNGERANVIVPAEFSLVMASTPCPCGWFGDDTSKVGCRCSPSVLERYRSRLAGIVNHDRTLVLRSDVKGGFEPGRIEG